MLPELSFAHATPILRVENFERSVAYYVDALGFSVEWHDGQFGCVRRGDATLMLCQGSQGATGTWVYIEVSDADAAFEEMSARGALIRHEPRNFPWGSRELHLFDIDRHVLRLGSPVEQDADWGAWLDEEGVAWQRQKDGSWQRAGTPA